jgi:3-dehydroquinate synthase
MESSPHPISPLQVEVEGHQYPIYIGRDFSASIVDMITIHRISKRPLAVVIDSVVAAQQACFVGDVFGDLPMIEIPSGESSKQFSQLERICNFLAQHRIDRSGMLIAVGGGVVGDLAGFAAAAYLRGIPFVQIPTTLLAMVDSSVGGKTGINIQAGKNLVGAFWQPKAVFADMRFLETLPDREFAAGMAEVIKYGMLYDAELFESLSEGVALSASDIRLSHVIKRCCAIKAEIVKADEKETASTGGRALLNLGHTFGHAIEAVAGYGTYLHGEAVAIGLHLATQLSVLMGYLDMSSSDRVCHVLEKYNLPTLLRAPLSMDLLMEAMYRDKKVSQGSLKMVVMKVLGEAITVRDVPVEFIRDCWKRGGAI